MADDTPQFWDGYTKYWDGYGRRAPKDPTLSQKLEAIMSKEIPCCWDEAAYLEQNKDVKLAVEKGSVASGWSHYERSGKKEGRQPCWISSDEFKNLVGTKFKANYIIATWSGPRREGNDEYHADPAHYVTQHIKSLQKYAHSLAQITVVVPDNPNEPAAFTTAIEALPKKIQNADVVVVRRKNQGQSYGGYSHVFGQYRSEFTYYFFIEDDYIFVKDNFDLELIKLLEMKRPQNCGYLCSLVTKLERRPHTAISNGIAKADTLERVWDKFKCLPHGTPNLANEYDCTPQLQFGWAFLEIGAQLQDYRDHYRAPFNDAGFLKIYGYEKNPDLLIPTQFLTKLGYEL